MVQAIKHDPGKKCKIVRPGVVKSFRSYKGQNHILALGGSL